MLPGPKEAAAPVARRVIRLEAGKREMEVITQVGGPAGTGHMLGFDEHF